MCRQQLSKGIQTYIQRQNIYSKTALNYVRCGSYGFHWHSFLLVHFEGALIWVTLALVDWIDLEQQIHTHSCFLQQNLIKPSHAISVGSWVHVSVAERRSLHVELHRALQ